MSFMNKGSMATTVTVSMEPDISGNWVCDGTADDVQLQAALDYVEALGFGGEVVVKPGQYYLDAKIEVPSYTVFRALSSPRYSATTTYLRITNGVNDDVVGNKAAATKVEIRNFDIYGNSANQANGHGINIDATDSIVEGNYVNNIKQNGINSTAPIATIRKNRYQNIDGIGISSTGADTQILFNDGSSTGTGIYVNAGNNEVIGNRCYNSGAEGIYCFTAGDYCTISENRCNDNTTIGIRVSGQHCVVSNNRLIDNTTHGIVMNAPDVVCVGNHSWSNTQYGIHLTNNAHRCTCDGNICLENGRHGIVLEDIEYTTVTGNAIMNNGQDGAYSGMWFYGATSCKYNVISSNTISDDQTGVETQQNGILMNNQAGIEQNLIVDNIIRNNQVYGISILAGPVSNTFKNNILTGNITAAINDLGTDTEVHEELVYVTDSDGNVGDHPVIVLPDAADTTFRFQVSIPLEFQELVTAQAVVLQTATAAGPPDMQWSTTTDWGKLCAAENYNAGSDAETDQTTAVAQNNLVCINVSASLTGIAAGDLVGFTFIRRGTQVGDTINADAYYLGFRLRYV